MPKDLFHINLGQVKEVVGRLGGFLDAADAEIGANLEYKWDAERKAAPSRRKRGQKCGQSTARADRASGISDPVQTPAARAAAVPTGPITCRLAGLNTPICRRKGPLRAPTVRHGPSSQAVRQAGGHWFEPSTAHPEEALLARGFLVLGDFLGLRHRER